MGKTAAERQREYRQRHLKDENGKLERVNILVDLNAKCSLERLAHCYGVTQRAILERVLAEAERRLLETLPAGKHGDYYDKRFTLDVTQ